LGGAGSSAEEQSEQVACFPADAPLVCRPLHSRQGPSRDPDAPPKRLGNPECISRELFTNALALAANRGLLQSGADGLADKRRRFAAETAAAVADVAAIGELDYRLRQRAQDR
jgi:glycerol-3-phosphate O-acyltransferase